MIVRTMAENSRPQFFRVSPLPAYKSGDLVCFRIDEGPLQQGLVKNGFICMPGRKIKKQRAVILGKLIPFM